MKKRTLLPLCPLVMGLPCLMTRRLLYLTATDGTGLLKTGTPLEWVTWLLTVFAVALFLFASRSGEEPCPPRAIAALGRPIGGAGILCTVFLYPGEMPGPIGMLWRVLGGLAGLAVIASACDACKGKTLRFLLSLLPCLFFLVQLVDNYRSWSGTPQLQSYFFPLMATVSLTLFTYYTAAQTLGLGKPRLKTFSALCAGYFGLAAALPGKGQLLYLLCALWALSSL